MSAEHVPMSGIGVNLRVTGHCCQGGRKYMEDTFSVAYQQTDDMRDLEYAYFGIFDGHGGPEAALYAKDHLVDAIVSQSNFWSDNDDDILRAIHDGYIQTHYTMWKHYESWSRTATGLPSTSGTTATIAFIRRGKIYVGHVGDSCLVLGYQEKGDKTWKARPLTIDHKPEAHDEISRITECGGKVVTKSGVPRVVWNRPRLGHKGPVRRSTPIDEIPFLAVARALGDFWSYNSSSNKFVVSPEPDVNVYPVDVETFRCLILGTDGLWNMLTPSVAVTIVQDTECHNEKQVIYPADQFVMQYNKDWVNPSKVLVDNAVKRWAVTKQKADNTSVVTLLLDPPGPPKAQILLNQKQLLSSKGTNNQQAVTCSDNEENHASDVKYHSLSPSGLAIFTRYPAMTAAQPSNTVPFSRYISSLQNTQNKAGISSNPKALAKKSNENRTAEESGLKKKRVSSSEPEISITNVDSSPASSCEKRRHAINNSYNFRLKQKLKLPDKEEERNSDVENMEQWSQRWNGAALSTPQSSVRKSRSKRRRCSLDNKPWNWNNSCPSSSTTLDKSHLHNKPKSFQEITTTRILRSDTVANTPVRTLRSRNIDLSSTISSTHTASMSSLSVMKPKYETFKSVNSKTCLHRSISPKAKCMRAASFSSSTMTSNQTSTTKKVAKLSSFGPSSSSVMTRRSSSKKIIK